MTAGRILGEARAATVIVTEAMTLELYPIWWRGIETPPPAAWTYVFECFTGEDTAEDWALAAAIFIAQTRRRTTLGPTFTELFTHLLPEDRGLPGPFPVGMEYIERCRAVSGFRGHVSIEWRRRGLISFDRDVTRSLRVGRVFRERSRDRQRARPVSSQLDSKSSDASDRKETRAMEAIRAAEWESVETCEECGAAGARQYVFNLWVSTLCAEHAAAMSPTSDESSR